MTSYGNVISIFRFYLNYLLQDNEPNSNKLLKLNHEHDEEVESVNGWIESPVQETWRQKEIDPMEIGQILSRKISDKRGKMTERKMKLEKEMRNLKRKTKEEI